MTEKITYAQSGVDIDAGTRAKSKIAKLAQSTFNDKILSEIGLFAGAYDLGDGRILLSSADGVGTKIIVAVKMGILNTVGIDLVHHCTNDILVHNAAPLFVLDYIGHTDLAPESITSIVEGLSSGCRNVGAALIGGETAQMPGFYPSGVFDLVGVIVGEVAQENLVNGERIQPGDTIIGFPSNGLHTNGYSLARKVIFDIAGYDVDSHIDELGETVGEALLRTHTLYLPAIEKIRGKVVIHGMAHITGGGVPGNLIRVLPDNCKAFIHKDSAPKIPIFDAIQSIGKIDEDEMERTFNMGFGYFVIVPGEQVSKAMEALTEFGAFVAGEVVTGEKDVELI